MANRKLQGEIERVLKKVDEGMQVFESIWDKVYSAPTTAQKEKYEGDLKKEIKKLQRLRDQIKTWQGDSSIKDKTKLDVNRKLIEEKMEKFKVCEKETKTKAFSKEGLAQDRTDPKEKAKREVGEWITDSIFKLREQCDEFEAEVEALSASGGSKRSRKADNPRIADLRTHIERHHFHVKSLERILRAVDNDALPPEKVNELRDGVDYYTDANQEPDFYEDEEMYDQLNLDMLGAATAPSLPPFKTKKEEEATAAEAAAAAAAGGAANTDASASGGDGKSGTSNGSGDALTRASSASPRAGKVGTSGAVSSPRNTKGGGGRSSSSGPSGRGSIKGNTPKTGSGGTGLSANSPMLTVLPSSVGPPQSSPKSGRGKALATTLTPAQLTHSGSGGAKGAKQSLPTGVGSVLGAIPASSVSGSGHSPSATAPASTSGPLMSAVVRGVSSSSGGAPAPSPSLRSSSGLASSPPSAVKTSPRSSVPSSTRGGAQLPAGSKAASSGGAALEELPLSASVSSGPAATPVGRAPYASPAVPPPAEAASHLGLLDAALHFMPESAYGGDVEAGGGGGGVAANGGGDAQGGGPGLVSGAMRSARNPAATPACFPSVPATAFNQAALFEKFDLDTLFFIFYYQQGTYQQYLAANELKRQSWRFHKKYLTWFQRHEEPKITTDEFEQGTYVYFDYHLKAESANGSQEYGWCQRVKSEFVFQYEYLE
ncbi:hypothetical protein MMPV_007072 [Pyropia vietnamensis]